MVSSLQNLRILLVEDEGVVALAMTTALEQQGASVTWVVSTVQALSALSAQSYSLIISNQRGSMDGCALLSQWRKQEKQQNLPPIRAIVLTGEFHSAISHQAKEAGFSAYLAKPITNQDLICAVAQVMGYGR